MLLLFLRFITDVVSQPAVKIRDFVDTELQYFVCPVAGQKLVLSPNYWRVESTCSGIK